MAGFRYDPKEERALELLNAAGIAVHFENTGGGCMVVEHVVGDGRLLWVTDDSYDADEPAEYIVCLYPDEEAPYEGRAVIEKFNVAEADLVDLAKEMLK